MKMRLPLYLRYFLLSNICLVLLAGCSYQPPAGKWTSIDATEIYFSGVDLGDGAIDPNYEAVCKEARDEVQSRLMQELPMKIAPLVLKTTDKPADISRATTLTLSITGCEIDVEQSGGSFTYYLSLPVKVSVMQNNESLLSYNMNTYEQVNVDQPGPEFEFTFAEPVQRTLLMFNGKQLWIPDG